MKNLTCLQPLLKFKESSPKTSVFKGVKCLLGVFRSFRLQFLSNPGSDRIGLAMAACEPSWSGCLLKKCLFLVTAGQGSAKTLA